MFAQTTSVAMVGAEARAVRIEAHVGKVKDVFTLVGLPDTAVREAKDRVRAAITSSGLDFPHRRVTVNLSPADLPKAGSDYDLPIALGVLAAAGELNGSLNRFIAAGELSLDGSVRRSRTAIGAGLISAKHGWPCVVADRDASTAARVPGAVVYPVASLAEAASIVSGTQPPRTAPPPPDEPMYEGLDDMAEVRGQPLAKRALEIAAAGGHHMLMVGSPGAGKTMLARRLPSILPPLTDAEAVEVACLWAAADRARGFSLQPPFRAPHHSASLAAIVGGGHGHPVPGEISLAHPRVLACYQKAHERTAMPVSAAIYVRISSDPTGQKAGVQRQEDECRALAASRRWTVAEVFSDNDLSASNGRNRPRYEALLRAVERGEINAIVAWHPDRLTRRATDLERFIAIVEKHRTAIATVSGGDYDLTTASGRMTARVVGNVAQHESEHKAERQRSKAAELARQGRNNGGGTRPFGFEADRVTIRESEAVAIRHAAADLLTGRTIKAILRDWERQGISTPAGKPWAPTPFGRMICRPRLAGLREHDGQTFTAVWPAIIPQEDHIALGSMFGSRIRGRRSPQYLLTGGIAVCGLCRTPLVARPRGGGARCYQCVIDNGGCGKLKILAEPFEGYVSGLVLDALDSPSLAAAIGKTTAKPGRVEELRDLERKKDALAAAFFVEGIIKKPQYVKTLAQLDDRIGKVTAELAASRFGTRKLRTGAALRDFWTTAATDERREVVEAVIESVAVGPGRRGYNRFDSDRVLITWRV